MCLFTFEIFKSITMKSLITAAIIICSFSISANARNSNSSLMVMDTTNQSSLSTLLTLYYDVKNALINGDAGTASAKAGEFSKAVKSVDMKGLSETEMNALMPLQDKLATDAATIAASKDIQKQRDGFASLSSNFYTLAKAVKLSDQPVYQAYCPMKKSYWLSSEAAVKNPYYGKMMLTCGKVTDTIQ